MKCLISVVLSLIACLSLAAQEYTLETTLSDTVRETSGLLYINNRLLTHNDSGNTNTLYEIDITNGNVLRSVSITNASNVDWEDLAYDDTYIYIGDFGNYDATRTNLKVYRVALADVFNSTSVTAEVINFNYSEQTDFSVQEFSTNFDAEALIHFNNKLYIFTKNWANAQCNIYELPKTPGSYSISAIDTIPSQGLVSGATYNNLNNSILLCGYDLTGSFLIELSSFGGGLFSNGNVIKTSVEVPTTYSVQTEGITAINANEYYISSEENGSEAHGLFRINLSTLTNMDLPTYDGLAFSPNPARNHIRINRPNYQTHIYTVTGQLVLTSVLEVVDVSDLKSGIYLVKLNDMANQNSTIKRLIIQK